MLVVFFICSILAYVIVIGLLRYGIDQVPTPSFEHTESKTHFTVIIPFRDEAENLPHLLASVSNLKYPDTLFEVLLVNDDSRDASVAVIESQSSSTSKTIRVINNQRTSNSPKKDAITTAIAFAKHEWIVTTDADCILPEFWLATFDDYIQNQHPDCIVAPVNYHGETSVFNRFQTLDVLSLQGATIGSFGIHKPLMCNGANFAYRKTTFEAVNGFEGNTNIASGDDMFLLEKLIDHTPQNVHYLKAENAIVSTRLAEDFKSLIQQRIRWASKASRYKFWFSKLVGLVIFAGNLVFLALLIALIWPYIPIEISLSLLVLKWSIDLLLLYKTTRFFKQESQLRTYLLSSLLYPLFNVSIALLSLFTTYQWKGRRFKQ
ncbi:glycosyltransferase family 2 protein [Winogradskyella arenosi]|uniref:Cellulose synthase/poly-beta-1,6-N-acetylglucosamine synthase-like glycosyltransferase n=1 Tax=Winogradskyella arenosi TaxID=533325 RepID=A0A368ZKG3_9FLAO|nr:glycosyltransferase [Winogradskyella arenosi]RCW93918.1 cellulose synthase/poly-beta-1,6-N-acetylglucosamine synthase-like glycosyltransferase [Winogradskyella arenosi]